MQKSLFILFVLSFPVFSEEAPWGVEVLDKKLKIGGRVQAIALSSEENQDMFLRRTRLNLEYQPWDRHKIVYDIRNDNSNKQDKGDGEFVIGDAYWEIKLDSPYINNIRLFRAKVDVSYSQTSSSKHLFNPLRASSSEKASDYLVQNRRAVNVQMNGNLNQLAYQLVVSDGVQSDDLDDIAGNEVDGVEKQKFSYGAKLRYYVFGDAKKNKAQDTFYGASESFSIGVGHFRNDKITVDNSSETLKEFYFQRDMTNLELSLALKHFRVLVESFQFRGDLIDLTQANKEDILGESNGGYAQVEFYVGKWAPYIIVEQSDKNLDADDAGEDIQTVGINFYDLMDARRFGIAHKKFKYGDDLSSKEDFEQVYIHAMLNF